MCVCGKAAFVFRFRDYELEFDPGLCHSEVVFKRSHFKLINEFAEEFVNAGSIPGGDGREVKATQLLPSHLTLFEKGFLLR